MPPEEISIDRTLFSKIIIGLLITLFSARNHILLGKGTKLSYLPDDLHDKAKFGSASEQTSRHIAS